MGRLSLGGRPLSFVRVDGEPLIVVDKNSAVNEPIASVVTTIRAAWLPEGPALAKLAAAEAAAKGYKSPSQGSRERRGISVTSHVEQQLRATARHKCTVNERPSTDCFLPSIVALVIWCSP